MVVVVFACRANGLTGWLSSGCAGDGSGNWDRCRDNDGIRGGRGSSGRSGGLEGCDRVWIDLSNLKQQLAKLKHAAFVEGGFALNQQSAVNANGILTGNIFNVEALPLGLVADDGVDSGDGAVL